MGSKIGIILAFLLSVAAAGGSYYLYQKWIEERNLRGSIEAEKDQLREKILVVQSDKQRYKDESEQFKSQSEEYQARAKAMQGQIEQLQGEQSKSNEERAALEQKIQGHQEMILGLQRQVEELDKKAKEAQQACLTGPVDMAAVTFTSPQSAEGSVSPVGVAATSSVTGTSASAARTDVSSMPVVGAKVLTVNRKFNFVVVNLGSQDQLKMGDKLKVVKQGQDTAQLQIEKLYDKFSAATILEENPQQKVVEGDVVQKV